MHMYQLVYVELKSGYSGNGPAWIGKAEYSKSGRTVYFNGKALRALGGAGISGNYVNIQTRDEYWVSGVKKNQQDRHKLGSGKILVDESIVKEYLDLVGQSELDGTKYLISALDNNFATLKARTNELENQILKK